MIVFYNVPIRNNFFSFTFRPIWKWWRCWRNLIRTMARSLLDSDQLIFWWKRFGSTTVGLIWWIYSNVCSENCWGYSYHWSSSKNLLLNNKFCEEKFFFILFISHSSRQKRNMHLEKLKILLIIYLNLNKFTFLSLLIGKKMELLVRWCPMKLV